MVLNNSAKSGPTAHTCVNEVFVLFFILGFLAGPVYSLRMAHVTHVLKLYLVPNYGHIVCMNCHYFCCCFCCVINANGILIFVYYFGMVV